MIVRGRGAHRPPWHARSLVPKLFGAFIAVLAVASLATLLIETNLTRSELARQTEDLAADQASTYQRLLAREQTNSIRSLRIFTQQVQIEGDDPQRALLDTLSVARRAGPFTLADAFDVSTGEYQLDPPGRGRISTPPPGSPAAERAQLLQGQRRVVPLFGRDDGASHGLVWTVSFTELDDVVLAMGTPLDGGYAREVRDLVGVGDVEVLVDDTVVASTLEDRSTTASADPDVVGLQSLPEDDLLVQYLPLAIDDGWSMDARVGLVIDDPLGPLDARLAVFRTAMLVLLLALGGAAAFAVATLMTRPLVRLTRTARVIAGGQLDASFEVTRADEIGQLAEALERMRRGLRSQLEVIGAQADALQSAARRVVGTRDRERQRLAKDLHDGIQQQLVVLRMQVGAARARLADDPAALEVVTEELAASIDRTLDDLRATAQALYPAILHDRGLGGALHSLASRSERTISLHLDPDPLPRVDEDVEANAYFLICEAVTNALKHAGEVPLSIAVTAEASELRIEVRDEGQGFDPEQVGHRGLQHLRDRVNALAGTLQVVSAPGEGTAVRALLPVARSAAVPPLEVEQDRRDPAVELELLGESELAEDGVGVLLHGPVRDRQVPRDGGVPPS